MTDMDLLQQYARTGDEQAFAAVVRQHVDVVYSAARRQTRGDPHLAEEVTQHVFTLLARKAKSLPEGVLLGGWLFNTVRFVARDALRKQQRRAAHEQKAAEMAQQVRAANAPRDDDPWHDAEEVLDEAMAAMPEQTRGLIVLKFFEGKTAREVGERLGISEEAARKRVSRAVDELRDLFVRRGVVMSAAGLAEALAVQAVMKAPADLAGAATSVAMSSTTAAASSAGGTGAAALLATAKAKLVALAAVGALAVGGGVAGGVKLVRHLTAPTAPRTVTVGVTGPTLSGTVLDPDGTPHVDAVALGTPTNPVNAYERTLTRSAAMTRAEGGRYVLPKPQQGAYHVIARCEKGYAEVSSAALEKNPNIQLRPWGRIEGVVLVGGRPQPNVRVSLTTIRYGNDPYGRTTSHNTSTIADAEGRFVFPQVVPGETWIMQQGATPDDNTSRADYAVVDPGQTVRVQFGGTGRTVTGRAVAPATTQPVAWTRQARYTYSASLRARREPPATAPIPNFSSDETPEQRRAVQEAFGRTPEGREYKKWMMSWNFTIAPDGTFQIDGVPPGTYDLDVRHMEVDRGVSFAEDWLTHTRQITVPPPSPGQSASPLATAMELGDLPLQYSAILRRGDAAPDFPFVTADGARRTLADYRGRHVLLIFWSGLPFYQDDEQEAQVSAAIAKWKHDPRLEILRLRLYDPETFAGVRLMAGARPPRGPGTIATLPDRGAVPELYRASPNEAVLIDPAGKIYQRHLRGPNVGKFLTRALREPATATAPAMPPAKE